MVYNILNHVGTADFHDGGKAFNCLYYHMNNASLCARLSSSMPISFSIALFHSVDVAYWFNYNYMLANLLR